MSEVTITLAPNGAFLLGVPSPILIHHIELPANEFGLKQMQKILKARVKRSDDGKISRASNPTQWQVEAWLKAEKIERVERQRQAELAEAAAALARFEGLALGELDL